eukprot:s460_g12.t1
MHPEAKVLCGLERGDRKEEARVRTESQRILRRDGKGRREKIGLHRGRSRERDKKRRSKKERDRGPYGVGRQMAFARGDDDKSESDSGGRAECAADHLAQRLKALELQLVDNGWQRAQYLELIAPEGANLAEQDEQRMAAREQAMEAKMRQQVQQRTPWSPDNKGKGDPKGKGRGKKGGKRGEWTGGATEVENGSDSEQDVVSSALRSRIAVGRNAAISLAEWQRGCCEIFKEGKTFADLGYYILESLRWLDTPLGHFIRTFCNHAQPPPAAEATYDRKGDLLPIHPSVVVAGQHGVTPQNRDWVMAVLSLIDFNYCTGWTKPVCVPMDTRLSANQCGALQELARTIDDNIMEAVPLPTLAEAKDSLQSKKYDYSGNPVEYLQDLVAEKVFPTWPKQGEAGVRCITDFLTGEALEAMSDPKQWVLPLDLQPEASKKSIVRASDAEWFRICSEGYRRGMMVMVSDDDVPKDRSGHLVVNGAGAVKKEKVINGQVKQLQRFISVLVPTNNHMAELPGAQDSLPYVGMLTALHIGPNEELVIDSEDFASAFNLFSVPDCWCPFFAYSKKVDGAAFGRPDLGQVRPALRVVPMGWRSSVTLIQAAVRRIVFDLAGVPRATSVEKGAPLPAGKHFTVVYLDNFDEVRILKKFSEELHDEAAAPSDTHVKFNEVCDELGLPRNEAKQLVGALSGGIQGGEFDGVRGTIKIGKDKLRNFLAISLALLGQPLVTEFQLRHWIGKAAFIATFRRPLFSILQEVFELLEKCKGKAQALPPAVVDEVVCFMVLATQAQSELKAKLSPVISCTDASPSGGGSAIATKFKTKSLVVPEEVPEKDVCGCCGTGFRGLDPERRLYVCPRRCGERFCSALCVADHSHGACTRQDFYAPTFGERFSGPRYPLTKACGLAGIAIQRPMDKLVPEDEWNILTESGKRRLAEAETDPALKAEHWAPECRTFSRARGRWIQLPDGGWIQGPRQVRSDDQPWGFNDLTKGDAVAVRQGNQFMKRSIKGLTKRHNAGGIASLEHPYNSYVWDTEEIAEMRSSGDWFETSYSHCCFGGTRVKWTLLFHNSPFLHQALHKPDCPGHADLENYRVTWTADGQLSFDTALEAMARLGLGVRVPGSFHCGGGSNIFGNLICIEGMLQPSVKDKVQSLLIDNSMGDLAKWKAISQYLMDEKIVYRMKIKADQLLVHPQNRGGIGLQVFNMHSKGQRILQCGCDLSLLSGSTCIELHPDPTKREAQAKVTKSLHESHPEYVAPVTGHERYLSLSSTHVSQFFKAMMHGCKSPEEDLVDAKSGKMSLGLEAFATMPTFIQGALNATNICFEAVGEMELLSTIALRAKQMLLEGKDPDFSKIAQMSAAGSDCSYAGLDEIYQQFEADMAATPSMPVQQISAAPQASSASISLEQAKDPLYLASLKLDLNKGALLMDMYNDLDCDSSHIQVLGLSRLFAAQNLKKGALQLIPMTSGVSLLSHEQPVTDVPFLISNNIKLYIMTPKAYTNPTISGVLCPYMHYAMVEYEGIKVTCLVNCENIKKGEELFTKTKLNAFLSSLNDASQEPSRKRPKRT